MSTKLDKILESVGEDGNLAPYFEELMSTTLIVPIDPESESEIEEEADPFVLEVEDMVFIPVFDTLDRFKAWVKDFGQDIKYLQLEGTEFFNAIDLDQDEVHVVVNHLTDYEEIIYPENIQWIQEQE
jgi:SseB protein N-terminal domain